MGLDDRMVGVALDHMLQLGDHMAGRDNESPRVAAHRLVCRAMKRDQPVTAELPALTAKRDDSIPASPGDGLVELAKSHLVERDAPRADVFHALVGQPAESVPRFFSQWIFPGRTERRGGRCWFSAMRETETRARPRRFGLHRGRSTRALVTAKRICTRVPGSP